MLLPMTLIALTPVYVMIHIIAIQGGIMLWVASGVAVVSTLLVALLLKLVVASYRWVISPLDDEMAAIGVAPTSSPLVGDKPLGWLPTTPPPDHSTDSPG